MAGKIILAVIICCEIYGLTSLKGIRLIKSFIFYTQLSNLAALISASLLLVFGGQEWIIAFRYLSVCMLIMTMLVTITILLPMIKNVELLLTSRSGFFLHLVGPILNTVSYFAFEPHASQAMTFIPPAVTLIYGIIMIYLNYINKVDGPYPFLRVHHQSKTATVLWIIVLLIVISAISWSIYLPAA